LTKPWTICGRFADDLRTICGRFRKIQEDFMLLCFMVEETEISTLVKENNTKNKKFYIYSKRLFLTYSRCPSHWTKEFVKEQLIDSILSYKYGNKAGQSKVKSWVISKEDHQEPIGEGDYERGIHFHCLVEGEIKIEIKDSKALDIEGIHGNYQAVRNVWDVMNYVKKHGDWIGCGFPGMETKELSILRAKDEVDAKLQMMNKMSVKDKLALREQIVTRTEKETIIKEITTSAPLYAFQEIFMPFKEGSGFVNKGRPMGLVMSGEANSGKTTMAYRVAEALGHDVAIYRDPKEMLHYDKEQVLMFDEMTKERFEANRGLLAMLVTEPQAKTDSYYGNKKVKWPRKLLIGTNENVENWEWDEATRSRFIVVKTKADNSYEFYKFEGRYLKLLTVEEVRVLMN
jgi:hypothetical protein